MATMGKWAELASHNERLVMPSDEPAEFPGGTAGGTASAADQQARGQARKEPGPWPDASGPTEGLARSA